PIGLKRLFKGRTDPVRSAVQGSPLSTDAKRRTRQTLVTRSNLVTGGSHRLAGCFERCVKRLSYVERSVNQYFSRKRKKSGRGANLREKSQIQYLHSALSPRRGGRAQPGRFNPGIPPRSEFALKGASDSGLSQRDTSTRPGSLCPKGTTDLSPGF